MFYVNDLVASSAFEIKHFAVISSLIKRRVLRAHCINSWWQCYHYRSPLTKRKDVFVVCRESCVWTEVKLHKSGLEKESNTFYLRVSLYIIIKQQVNERND